ncbi:MAG: SDR family NAD(P)-dependent oxidoreductase [Rikenellaceae bacterium]|nr:SDR family NAD(P)-dependent oxidoreductase [Rikenellaceae bacterium]
MMESQTMSSLLKEVVPALRAALSGDGPLRTLHVLDAGTTIPDIYSESADPDRLIALIDDYKNNRGALPGTIMIEGAGMVFLEPLPASLPGRMAGKTVVVTGAGQGFGEGIARELYAEGANIVIADINGEGGGKTAKSLESSSSYNRVISVRTDVSNTESIERMIERTVASFGGIDLFVSNAGVLHAGGLGDMTPEEFEFVTRINYNAFFYCVKSVSKVMKLQNRYAPHRYCDIIQVNSKSGLRGSKANFAYAGSKFGGIGLVQSFALELAPFRIKVNAVCPGNYYEGPLWADPDNGLFVQYLRAGKVPGARTVEDVRSHYMSQVPMGKGTSPADVAKAIMYAVEQECETGQAIPVTGGQVMLG